MTLLFICDKILLGEVIMKNRSELREIIMKVLYQVYIYNGTNTSYNIDDLIKEQLEVENEFVDESVKNIIAYPPPCQFFPHKKADKCQ